MDIFDEIDKSELEKNNAEKVEVKKVKTKKVSTLSTPNKTNKSGKPKNDVKVVKRGNLYYLESANSVIVSKQYKTLGADIVPREKRLTYAFAGKTTRPFLVEDQSYASYIRGEKIAKYIDEAQCCDEKKREKLREKAIKLLNKEFSCLDIKAAICDENFSDRLGIYEYIHKANQSAIQDALVFASKFENQGQISRFIKYIDTETVMGINPFIGVDLVSKLTEQELKDFFAVRPEAVSMLKIDKMTEMSEKQIEVCFNAGFGISKKGLEELIDRRDEQIEYWENISQQKAKQLEQTYGDFLDDLYQSVKQHYVSRRKTTQTTERTKTVQTNKQSTKQVSEVEMIDKIFNQAVANIEKEQSLEK